MNSNSSMLQYITWNYNLSSCLFSLNGLHTTRFLYINIQIFPLKSKCGFSFEDICTKFSGMSCFLTLFRLLKLVMSSIATWWFRSVSVYKFQAKIYRVRMVRFSSFFRKCQNKCLYFKSAGMIPAISREFSRYLALKWPESFLRLPKWRPSWGRHCATKIFHNEFWEFRHIKSVFLNR